MAQDTVPQRCICTVSPEIVPAGRQGTIWTYKGLPHAACMDGSITFASKGPGLTFSDPVDSCGVSSVTYSWSIVSGEEVAALTGSTTGSMVDVSISGNGSFTLNLVNTVTCSDGSTCSYYAYYTDTARVDSSHCTCAAGPIDIQPAHKEGILWTYQGTVQGSCSGQYGLAPNLDSCRVQNTLYQWSIDGGGVAAIVGPADGQTVNVSISGNGVFSLRLEGTTVCSDGQRCSNYTFLQDSARLDSPRSCSCSVDVDCERGADKGGLRTYNGVLKGGCTGEYGASAPYLPCAIKNVNWSWTITEGSSVVEIVGPANQQTVQVNVKGSGAYTLRVQADVECSDGTKSCGEFNFDYCMDSASVEKKCNISVDEFADPPMDGGLKTVSKNDPFRRDDFVVLTAEAKDFDQVRFTCTPSEQCDKNQKTSTDMVVLNGKVRFEWKILEGEGAFVQVGCLPKDTREDKGERVIFQPPYVPLPTGNEKEKTSTTVIELRMIDETGNAKLKDKDALDKITITTKRTAADPDKYLITVISKGLKLPAPPAATPSNAICQAAYGWKPSDDLKTPVIKLPAQPQSNKLLLGQLIRLEAVDQGDKDELNMTCTTVGNVCESAGEKRVYDDNIEWEWDIVQGGGTLVGGKTGRFVVYEAPKELAEKQDHVDVIFRLTVRNAPGGQRDPQKVLTDKTVLLQVFQGGIKLSYPDKNWLPEEANHVQLKSYLVYRKVTKDEKKKEQVQWLPAFEHTCRIQFFDLLEVSNEKGLCLNEPVFKADDANQKCRDLLLKNESGHEAFNDDKPQSGIECNKDGYFLQARTQKPEREYSVKIHSEDFGSYGLLASFANVHAYKKLPKNEKPLYISVPVRKDEVKHPSNDKSRQKQAEDPDNRVPLPHDVDENRIADGGWKVTSTGTQMNDPKNNRDDKEEQPAGDGFDGDGCTNYEEYRGFRVIRGHIRTSIVKKDVFLQNEAGVPVTTYASITGLDVNLISDKQSVDFTPQGTALNKRIINFNFNPATHNEIQSALLLVDKGESKTLLGIASTQVGNKVDKIPAPPNWVNEIRIYGKSIQAFVTAKKIKEDKLQQIIAHELCHGNNVYHHGDPLPTTPEGTDAYYDNFHGLRSGDTRCIMRYDNSGAPYPPGSTGPEPVGTILCKSHIGTGYNKPDTTRRKVGKKEKLIIEERGFGNADEKKDRGNCQAQIRISGRLPNFKQRD